MRHSSSHTQHRARTNQRHTNVLHVTRSVAVARALARSRAFDESAHVRAKAIALVFARRGRARVEKPRGGGAIVARNRERERGLAVVVVRVDGAFIESLEQQLENSRRAAQADLRA